MYSHQPGPQATQTAGKVPAAKTVAATRPTGVRPGRAAGVLALQRLAGNAAVTRLIAAQRRDAVQAALSVQGHRLTPKVRADMEAGLGADLSDVHVHTGPAADRAAQAVSAQAFTSGSHLVFRRGAYDPSSATGRRVLAHELAHVLQQRRGPVAGTGDALKISHPADRFEREAEATALRVTSARPVERGSLGPSRAPASRPVDRTRTRPQVQRHYTGSPHLLYGPLYNGSGTAMNAELHPPVSMGSVPKVKPPWWPTTTRPGVTQPTVSWFSRYMVQGHLLNHNVGGPGNTMSNLTPITKAANHLHETNVEHYVKAEIKKGNIVDYEVDVHYSPTPTGVDIVGGTDPTGVVAGEIQNNFVTGLAYKLFAQYAVYDPTGKFLGYGQSWNILNQCY